MAKCGDCNQDGLDKIHGKNVNAHRKCIGRTTLSNYAVNFSVSLSLLFSLREVLHWTPLRWKCFTFTPKSSFDRQNSSTLRCVLMNLTLSLV